MFKNIVKYRLLSKKKIVVIYIFSLKLNNHFLKPLREIRFRVPVAQSPRNVLNIHIKVYLLKQKVCGLWDQILPFSRSWIPKLNSAGTQCTDFYFTSDRYNVTHWNACFKQLKWNRPFVYSKQTSAEMESKHMRAIHQSQTVIPRTTYLPFWRLLILIRR